MAIYADLPPVHAGPLLRRVTPERVTWWLATRAQVDVEITLHLRAGPRRTIRRRPGDAGCRQIRAAAHLNYVLLDISLDEPLPLDEWIDYEISLRLHDEPGEVWHPDSEWAEGCRYERRQRMGFVIRSRVHSLLHGSCRKPHHDSDDALAGADRWLAAQLSESSPGAVPPNWPSFLAMTGDQIYADDVSGPMLVAIHTLVDRLGFPAEDMRSLQLGDIEDSHAVYADPDTYYRREQFLPKENTSNAAFDVLFGGARKPVFTTASAHNHLVTVAEVLCMYLLVWSPVPWRDLKIERPGGLTPDEEARFIREEATIEQFVAGLGPVRRLFAHLPIAMIFDDHDVSDDWNLNRAWEESAYNNPFSARIIGNALLGYCLNQGWGNQPEAFPESLIDSIETAFDRPGSEHHDTLLSDLLRFEHWNYSWPTEPPLIVLDTRTRRWRSETSASRPSGLLDWEAVTDLQRELREIDSVLLVSAAPIFGVKVIEAIQRLFVYVGKPLLVDAENWMAHPGTGDAILNVFRHRRTPSRFVILSGDVHYSFVYDVELRGHRGGPDIWQICSSGLRNAFPERLLNTLDHLNRWLYSPRSPLNWLTRRRRMRVVPRKPKGTPRGRRLLNHPSIGLVRLKSDGSPEAISQLLPSGELIDFERREDESIWD